MNKFITKLRIGEKMALGFGLVGTIFFVVIWQYHVTLTQSLNNYSFLNTIYSSKKDLVNDIEVGLLMARQSEKDFLLNHQLSDSKKVIKHVDQGFITIKELSNIDNSAAESSNIYNEKLQNYLIHFRLVEDAWIIKGLTENSGLQGAFRKAVHALEAMVKQVNNKDIYVNLLQLRRREKDYILRGDQKYVDLALNTIQLIHKQLEVSQFSANERAQFVNLLGNYQRDFNALVEQNNKIKKVVEEMEDVAIDVSKLVNQKVIEHNKTWTEKTMQISELSVKRASLMFWMVIIAIILGFIFAFNITVHITRPLRKMAGVLESLTYSENLEKMPYQSGGRDEVNAMVGSLNILCDHRKSFIDWWKSSMRETETCQQLDNIIEQLPEENKNYSSELQQIKSDLKDLLSEKKKLISKEYHEIEEYNGDIINQSSLIGHASIPRDEMDKAASSINYKANIIQKKLAMLSSNTE